VVRVIVVVKGKVPVGGEPLVLKKIAILAFHRLIHRRQPTPIGQEYIRKLIRGCFNSAALEERALCFSMPSMPAGH
jgi:hypothetical protein